MSLEHWKMRQRQAKEKIEVKIGREMTEVENAFFSNGFWEGYYSGNMDVIGENMEIIKQKFPNLGE